MRIVVADENDIFRGAIVDVLKDDGHEVHAVSHGGEVVSTARRVQPDLIITHARFADMSAIEALEFLTRENIRIPTILMSGDPAAFLPELDALGVVACLEKPFSIAQLHAKLAELFPARASCKLRTEPYSTA